MTTTFPTTQDTFPRGTIPAAAGEDLNDWGGVTHSVHHDNSYDAIEALENKVGHDGDTDSNSIDYKIKTIRTRLTKTVNQTIATGVDTAITFNATDNGGGTSEEEDVGGNHSTASNTSRITPTHPGLYLFTAYVAWVSGAGQKFLKLYLNGSEYVAKDKAASGGTDFDTISFLIPCNGTTDFVEMFVAQTSGGDLDTESARFNMVRLAGAA